MKPFSENTRKVFDYLKANHGTDMTAADIAEAVGLTKSSVNGIVTGIQKKGLSVRVPAEIELEDGTHKEIKFIKLSDEGMALDPDTLVEDAE